MLRQEGSVNKVILVFFLISSSWPSFGQTGGIDLYGYSEKVSFFGRQATVKISKLDHSGQAISSVTLCFKKRGGFLWWGGQWQIQKAELKNRRTLKKLAGATSLGEFY
ncbi:MAG: hypothetical protein AAB392_02510 [Patescibacteria group bacterium]